MFLVLAVAYGIGADQIHIRPIDEELIMNGKTLPTLIAYAMGIVAFLILVLPNKNSNGEFLPAFHGLRWKPVFIMFALMVAYGLLMNVIGFILATILFLSSSFYTLGERRPAVNLGTSFAVSIGIWALMTKVFTKQFTTPSLYYLLGIN